MSNRTDQDGLTLLEAVAATAILAAAVVAGLELFGLQQSVHAEGLTWSEATMFANREVERSRSEVFEDLASTAWSTIPENTEFRTRRTVTSVDTTLKRVEVEVTWTTARGTDQSVTNVTFVFDR